MGGTTQEICGVFFAATRDYLLEQHGEQTLERVAERAGPEAGSALRSPVADDWYPEETFREVLRAFCEVTADGDPARFEEIIRSGAVTGIRQFVQIITRQTAPRELLQRAPSLWSLLRRGPGRLRVEAEPERVLMCYEHFPRIDDPIYVPFFRGLVASMLEASSGYVPPINVIEHDDDRLVLEVRVSAA